MGNFFGSVITIFLGAVLALLGEHYILGLSTREKYREKLVDRQIHAYESYWYYYQEYGDMHDGILKWWKKHGFYFSDEVVGIQLNLLTSLGTVKSARANGTEPSQDALFSVPTLTWKLINQMRREIYFGLLNTKRQELFKIQ